MTEDEFTATADLARVWCAMSVLREIDQCDETRAAFRALKGLESRLYKIVVLSMDDDEPEPEDAFGVDVNPNV